MKTGFESKAPEFLFKQFGSYSAESSVEDGKEINVLMIKFCLS